MLIEFEAVCLASKCLFGNMKVTGVAVIAVTLSGIMVTSLPYPYRWQLTASLRIKGRESLMRLTKLVTQSLFYRLLAHLVTKVKGFNIDWSHFSRETRLDTLLYRRYF
jgi:hypothetical protein